MFQKISAMSNDLNKNAWYLNEVYLSEKWSLYAQFLCYFATASICPKSLCLVNNELATIAMKPNIYKPI